MDKKFFKRWVLHIPHRLRDLLWMVRAWSLVAPTFSYRASSSCEFSSQSLLKLITCFWNTFLSWMNLMILGGHLRWPSPFLHSGSSHSSTSFSRSYSDFCSSLQIAWSRNQTSSVSFREDTCGTNWSMTESTMIFLDLTKFFLCKASSLISLWNWNLSTHVGVQSISSERSNTSMLGICELHQAYHQYYVIDHFEMRTSNENSKGLDLTDLRCPSSSRSLLI